MRTPLATLVCLLAAAVITLAGGMRLARREVQDRHPVDRRFLHTFAEQWQEELDRLQAAYEDDLRRLAGSLPENSPQLVREQCAELCGVAAFAALSPMGSGVGSVTIRTASALPAPLPTVALLREGEPPDSRPAGGFYVRPSQLLRDAHGNAHGWISSEDPIYRGWWQLRNGSRVAVLTLDWQAVQRRTVDHLAHWSEGPAVQARALGVALAVSGPNDAPVLRTGGSEARQADVIVPLRKNRFGSWQIAAWDQVTVRTGYDPRAIGLAAAMSGVLAIVGAALYREQQRAQVVAEQRVSFVNRVSHELGTPLTNMLLNLDLAKEAVAAAPDQSRRRIRLVTEETQRLARLVSNVLTFSRRERGVLRLQPEWAIPDNIVQDVLAQFDPALARRGIAVEFEAGASAAAMLDPDALAQIIGNLVSNVEKYAADGKRLAIRTAHAAGALRVRVEDCGPGIPTGDCERIFLPFHRVRSRVNEGASGTGLGLAIARDLARGMGGDLALVESAPGCCIFELSVPAEIALQALPSGDGRSAA